MTLPTSPLRSLRSELEPGTPRAGTDEQQRRLGLLAWEMAEIWTVPPPHGHHVTRLSAEWLRHKGWRVASISFDLSGDDEGTILSTIRRLGHERWLGTAVDPGVQELTAVWNWGYEKGTLNWWLTAYSGVWTMAFTPERDFAILGDGDDLLTVAGPVAFLRDALGDLRERWLDFEEDRMLPESAEDLGSRAYYEGYMAHYEPFIARA